MSTKIDIDPRQQDWGMPGHYDYDAVYWFCQSYAKSMWPHAAVTRETIARDRNRSDQMFIVSSDNEGEQVGIEQTLANIDITHLPWIDA